MDINQKLQEAGLTGNEAQVYLELLKKGELSANQIAKNLGIDRTLTYTILNHLIEKGQVKYILKQGKKMFSSSNPENLLNKVKAKEVLITGLISELKNLKKETPQETQINIYEGKEGLRTILHLVLKHNGFCSFGATGRAFHALYEMPAIAKQLEKSADMKIKIVGNKKLKGTEAFDLKGVEFRYLDIKSEATTSIFGDYVSIHMIKNKPIIILIKNKDIAESYRNHFNLLWKTAKP